MLVNTMKGANALMYRFLDVKNLTRWFIISVAMISFMYGQEYPDEFLNGEMHKIQSEILQQERIIFVYLPRDYEKSNRSYPVHYITDAPTTANLFYDLLTLHALTNGMPRSIVVGLQSNGREVNLHPEKGAQKYLGFIEQEVIPYVETTYRTKPFRSIVGHSLGGGFAIYAFLVRTNLFNFCIAGSPYPLDYLTDMMGHDGIPNKTSDPRFFYSSIGTVSDIPAAQFEDFKRAVMEKAPQNVKYAFQINEGERHISNIAVNFQEGLEYFYRDWQFVLLDTLSASIDALLADHYQKLSQKVGYTVEPGEWEVIFPVMDQLAKRGDFQNALQALNYCIELYPQSDQAYAFLARAYISTGDRGSAQISLEKALSINPHNEFALQIKSALDR